MRLKQTVESHQSYNAHHLSIQQVNVAFANNMKYPYIAPIRISEEQAISLCRRLQKFTRDDPSD